MKMKLLFLGLMCIMSLSIWSQCVPTCSNYAVSPISFTTFPSGSTNVTPTFTNPFIGIFADDGSIGPIPIGFNFDYYCNTYTSIHICSNGFIMLDYQAFPWPTQFVHPTQSLPSSALPDGMIAFNMTDLDPGQGGTITYTTVGTAPNRRFIVTYSNVPCFSTPADLNTGQIVLFETSNAIEIHTTKARPDINQLALGGTQGIENTNGSIGVTPPGRNANNTWGATSDSTAFRFLPFTPTPPASVSGNTLLCQGTQGAYQTNPIISALSYTWSLPAGWNGSSSTTVISPTAGSSGNVSVSAIYTCGISAPAIISVSVVPAPIVSIQSATPTVLCSGKTITLQPTGAVFYTVEPGGITGTPPIVIQVNATTIFSVTGENAAGCASNNTATVNILAYPTPTVSVNGGLVCLGESFTLTPSGADNYSVSGGFAIVTPTLGLNNYSVTGTSTNGCVGETVVAQVTAVALPTVNVVSSRSVICVNESAILTASGANSYTWSTSATTATISVSPTSSTNFTVTGELNSCKNSKVFLQGVSICMGFDETTARTENIVIFPNPAVSSFYVKLNTSNPQATLKVFDLTNRLVKTTYLDNTINTVDVQDLSEGLYNVHIQNGNEIWIQKMVITH
jgi:hypothetical protein